MRKVLASLAAVALVAGCANTPVALVESGPPSADWTSAKAPVDLAACISRNADELDLGLVSYPSSMRPGKQAGTYDVVHGGFGRIYFYALVEPKNDGARARLWRSPMPFLLLGTGSLEEQLRNGC